MHAVVVKAQAVSPDRAVERACVARALRAAARGPLDVSRALPHVAHLPTSRAFYHYKGGLRVVVVTPHYWGEVGQGGMTIEACE